MKVLITGGAGFIGSNLADRLLDEGHEVLSIDNYATGRRGNLTERDGLTILEGSITGLELDRAFEDFKPDHVVHTAASYKDPDAWDEDVETNAQGTAAVVRAAQKHGAKRFIYFQTALCYGTKPIEQPITLSHPIRPDSSYAISKTAGEQYIALGGVDFVSLRLANVYGPRNVSGPLPTFFQRLTDGKACFVMDTRRDFVFVDDLIDVVMKALDGTGSGYYHVSSGSDVSIKELFDATIAAMGIELEEDVEVRPRAEDDAASILLDPSRTEKDFEWQASTPLTEGVAKAIEDYRQHGVGETYTHLKVVN
ncbi:MAG: UDP-glucose 4-epimerase [Solirubrobacteraceae bacterium]|nr:UDP-glucose 4-epimerase [Solirubrobacteraceae bacterium]